METTKKIQEEIVEPETETTTEEIVDVKDENGDTVLTDDEYNKLKRKKRRKRFKKLLRQLLHRKRRGAYKRA